MCATVGDGEAMSKISGHDMTPGPRAATINSEFRLSITYHHVLFAEPTQRPPIIALKSHADGRDAVVRRAVPRPFGDETACAVIFSP